MTQEELWKEADEVIESALFRYERDMITESEYYNELAYAQELIEEAYQLLEV